MTELRVLGRTELLQDGRVVRFRSAKVIELLAFLASEPEGRARRATVADALYPDSGRARENLRQTLLYLAKSAEGVVVAEGDELRLLELESDLALFQQGRLEAYCGPFLPGCDSHWALAARGDLEQQLVSLLVSTGSGSLADDPTGAAALARRAIQIDPYLEQARRLRWRALERLGEPAVAAAERSEYAAFIKEEVGIELAPAPELSLGVPPSLTAPERLLRTVALIPESFEHGGLAAVAEVLAKCIDEVAPGHPYLALGWIVLARLRFEIGETAGAAEAALRGREIELAREQELELLATEARIQARLGHLDESETGARRVIRSEVPEVRAEGHLLLSYLWWARSEFRASICEAERSFEVAHEAGLKKFKVRALRSKSGALFRAGRIPEAITALEEGIVLAEEINRIDLVAGQQADLGRLFEIQGDLPAALASFRQAVAALEKTDFRVPFAQAVTYLADLEHRLGNFAEAARLHAIAVAARRIMGDLVGLATSYRGLGKAQLEQGDFAQAVESLRFALRLFRRFGEAGSIGSVRIPLARALYAVGEDSEGKRQAQQGAVDLFGISEEDITIRYNDPSLLPHAVRALVERMTV